MGWGTQGRLRYKNSQLLGPLVGCHRHFLALLGPQSSSSGVASCVGESREG
jgi:hypothetical protein